MGADLENRKTTQVKVVINYSRTLDSGREWPLSTQELRRGVQGLVSESTKRNLRELAGIQSRIYEGLGLAPWDIRPMPETWRLEGRVLIEWERLRRILEKLALRDGQALIVDNLAMRLVPIWIDIFKEFDITPIFVFLLSDPRRLDDEGMYGLAGSQLAWLRGYLEAEEATRGFERQFIPIRSSIDHLAGLISLPQRADQYEAPADHWILPTGYDATPSLSSVNKMTAGGNPNPWSSWCENVYQILSSVPEYLDMVVRLEQINNDLAVLAPPIEALARGAEREISSFRRQRDEAQQEVVSVRQSRSWRVARPLRFGGRQVRRVAASIQTAHREALIKAMSRNNGILIDNLSLLGGIGLKKLVTRDLVKLANTDARVRVWTGARHAWINPGDCENSWVITDSTVSLKVPRVSIVVLNFNKAFLTEECLEALWVNTSGCEFEVLVVDNGSSIDDFLYLNSIPGPFRILRLEINRYFGEGNNLGAEAVDGEIVVFMNNDVVVREGWLEPLLNAFEVYPDCGVAGSKLIYPDGRLQEAGALIDEEGRSVQLGKFGEPNDPDFNRERVVDYCSAAAIAIRSETFREVGGFDFIWEPAYYEDVDLCLKVASLGYSTYYIPTSEVIHRENATSADEELDLRLHNIVELNRGKFVARWAEYIRSRQDRERLDLIFPIAVPVHHLQGRKRAAIFSPYNFIPGGGEKYLLTIAESLSHEYDISFVTPVPFSRMRMRTLARRLGIHLEHFEMETLDHAKTVAPFDVFITLTNSVIPTAPALGRCSILIVQFPFKLNHRLDEAARREWIGYNSVVVYSDFVATHLREAIYENKLPRKPLKVVNPPVSPAYLCQPRVPKLLRIVSVGRFFIGGHSKRQDLLIKAFASLYERVGGRVEFHLVGSLHPEAVHREYFLYCQALAEGLPVYFHLDASESEIKGLYQDSLLYWHGAGIPSDGDRRPESAEHFGISVVEAMAMGCIPIVYNYGGPSSTVVHGLNGYTFDTLDELVEISEKLLLAAGSSQLEDLESRARSRAADYSAEVFAKQWIEMVAQYGESR